MNKIKKICLFFLLTNLGMVSDDVFSLEGGGAFVGDVSVEGNRFIKKKSVLSKVKTRKGDVVVDPLFRSDVERLLETNLYDDVQVALEEIPGTTDAQGRPFVRVLFRVQERPIIRRVDFKGNLKLSDGKFREEISSKPGEPFARYKAVEDVDKILSKYREEGYADAQVEFYTALNSPRNKLLLTFFVTEGNRILVQSVSVQGNKAVSTRKIRRLMKKTRRKKVFKQESLRDDLERVEKHYKNQGYLEVKIDPPQQVFNEDHTRLDLKINIQEGRLFTMGVVSFTGNSLYSGVELTKGVVLKKGKLYRQDKMDETEQNLKDLYADKGYLMAQIIPQTITESLEGHRGRVDIHFEITESSVVYVDRVYVDGNTYTKDHVLLREVLLKDGDIFSAGKVRRSVERIYNLGFLDDVQVDVQQPHSPTKADLVFTVVEGKPGILSAGAGYSSVDGLLGTLQVQHINIFGRAQRLNLLWEFGKHKQNYEIGWTDPWFLGKNMSFGIDLFNTIRDLPYKGELHAYTKSTKGFGFRMGPRLSDQLSLIHSYSYERVSKFDIDKAFENDVEFIPLKNITSSLTNGIVQDTRDNIFDATRGMRNSASLQWAGGPLGGSVNFYKPEVSSAIYFPTFWKFVLSFSARGGSLWRYGASDNVPVEERFIVGGVDTVRGYEPGRVGVGSGRAMLVLNAEYKFPIVQERNKTILQGAFFADMGGSWDTIRDLDLEIGSRVHQMRSSAGFGIRFKTPVFPIRLDWAYPLNRRDGESLEQFNFTIGNIF